MKIRTWSMVTLRTWLLLPCKTSPNALGKETRKANISGSTYPQWQKEKGKTSQNKYCKEDAATTYLLQSVQGTVLVKRAHPSCSCGKAALRERPLLCKFCTDKVAELTTASAAWQELQLFLPAEPCQKCGSKGSPCYASRQPPHTPLPSHPAWGWGSPSGILSIKLQLTSFSDETDIYICPRKHNIMW